MNYFQTEQQIDRLTLAIAARNSGIIKDLIGHLRSEFTSKEIGGLLLLSLERLLWLDPELCIWAMENMIPEDLKIEIRELISLTTYKQLIAKGLVPGRDFSMNGNGTIIRKKAQPLPLRMNLTQNVA